MKSISSPRLLIASLQVLGLCLATLQASDASDVLNKQFKVKPGGSLVIHADRGSIDITNSASDTVDIVVERKAKGSSGEETLKRHKVEFTQSGNVVNIAARLPSEFMSGWRSPRLEVRYRVAIPRQFNVDLHTAGGAIHVPDLDGNAIAETAGGSIHLAGIKGTVKANTAGGSIHVADCGKTLSAETAGGSIKVGKCAGEAKVETAAGSIDLGSMAGVVHASTAGGSIKIGTASGHIKASTADGSITVDEAAGGVDAETSAGSVTVGFAGSLSSDSKLATSGGGITVRFPGDAALRVDAEAVGGRVVSDLPVTVQGEAKRSELHGTINGGGKVLRLSATAGSINIRKR